MEQVLEKDIAVGIKLIAEFMDMVPCDRPYEGAYMAMPSEKEDGFVDFVESQMGENDLYVYPKFDSSWDWLMPVIQRATKVELPNGQYGKHIDFSISFNDEATGWIFWTRGVPGDQNQPQSYHRSDNTLLDAFRAVVDAILFVNSHK